MIIRRDMPTLALIVPCYNEELVIAETITQLQRILATLQQQQKIADDSFIYCVDDGSQDATWSIIVRFHQQSSQVKGIRLSRNFGHQNALLAGMLALKDKVDCAISIDADLQQDIDAIPEFLQKFREGADMVFGIRRDREVDSAFKRITGDFFYNAMNKLGVRVIKNHPDYRLVSNDILQVVAQHPEVNLFLRALFVQLGFQTAEVYYTNKERFAGETKYPLKKMLSLAWDGVTSFSITPLRLVSLTGLICFLFSLLIIVYILAKRIFIGGVVPGWASTTLPIYLLGGIQILCIGLIGEYIAKIYKEVKRRPRYIKREELL